MAKKESVEVESPAVATVPVLVDDLKTIAQMVLEVVAYSKDDVKRRALAAHSRIEMLLPKED